MKTLVKKINVVISDSSLPVIDLNEMPIVTSTDVSASTGMHASLLNPVGELDICEYEAEAFFHTDVSSFIQFNIGIVSDSQFSDWISAEEGEIFAQEWNSEIAPNLPTSRTFTFRNTLSMGAFAVAGNFIGTVEINIWKVTE